VELLFSTADVEPRDRFDYWHSVACRTIVDHSSRPQCRHTFEAELQWGALADIGVVRFTLAPMEFSHARRHLAQVKGDELFVCRLAEGTIALEQNGREAVLAAGDVTLLDPLLPYSGHFPTASELLVLKVPRREIEARVGKARELVGRLIRPGVAEHGFTSAFLAMLPDHAGNLEALAAEIVKDQALDLVALSLARAAQAGRPRLSSARSLVLMSIRAAVEARLADPALDAGAVAAAAGVSVRYANAVLARAGTSIMRLIWDRRLARCRKALEDPLQAHRTVSEIAYGWGFSDMTHFGRRFKAAYGMLPTDCRRLARSA
jgi:AraC-like DNA-binding protein